MKIFVNDLQERVATDSLRCMRICGTLVSRVVALAAFVGFLMGQSASEKQIALGKAVASGLVEKDGRIEDLDLNGFVLSVAKRVGVEEILITRGTAAYVRLLPSGVAISGTMIARVGDEAELAGLIAHAAAHRAWRGERVFLPLCVLAGTRGEDEEGASRVATEVLRGAGYGAGAGSVVDSSVFQEFKAGVGRAMRIGLERKTKTPSLSLR